MKSVFIIDDDAALCRSLQLQLTAKGYEAQFAGTAAEGIARIKSRPPDMILLDLTLPDRDGLSALQDLQSARPGCAIVIITARQDMKATISAMRAGATDYIRKPFDMDDVVLAIEKAEKLIRQSENGASEKVRTLSDVAPREIVGSDKKIIEVLKQIGVLSKSRINVLITGESGAGKELVARALHEAGSPGKPFVAVNCSALVPTLLESELFGHERGAFTGADRQKIGKLETAGDGTVFFDEIGDMPVELQPKLLRVLQELEFERVGGTALIAFKARVVAASHQDLKKMMKDRNFREDLFFRLAVSEITLPPLRERRSDIRALVHYFINKAGERLHKRVSEIDEDAMKRLETYDWPGNVRELENVLTRAVALSRTSTLLALDIRFPFGTPADGYGGIQEIKPLAQVEREYIEKALFAMEWNITRTAERLRISPTTLRKKIADYDLRR